MVKIKIGVTGREWTYEGDSITRENGFLTLYNARDLVTKQRFSKLEINIQTHTYIAIGYDPIEDTSYAKPKVYTLEDTPW